MPKDLILQEWEVKFGPDHGPENVYEEIHNKSECFQTKPGNIRCGLAREFAVKFKCLHKPCRSGFVIWASLSLPSQNLDCSEPINHLPACSDVRTDNADYSLNAKQQKVDISYVYDL